MIDIDKIFNDWDNIETTDDIMVGDYVKYVGYNPNFIGSTFIVTKNLDGNHINYWRCVDPVNLKFVVNIRLKNLKKI